jgi:hypothetical protein
MHRLLIGLGRLAGAVGILLLAVSVLVRASGGYSVGDFEAVTLLRAGVAAMVAACLAYVVSMADPAGR